MENILNRLQRGLSGYISYLAACDMNPVFTEYLLYEPILRILLSQRFKVKCEYRLPHFTVDAGGIKRVDFVATRRKQTLAIEVKWLKKRQIDTSSDRKKLIFFQQSNPKSSCVLCVFGRKSFLQEYKVGDSDFKERGKAVYAEFRTTRYGCRLYSFNQETISKGKS